MTGKNNTYLLYIAQKDLVMWIRSENFLKDFLKHVKAKHFYVTAECAKKIFFIELSPLFSVASKN